MVLGNAKKANVKKFLVPGAGISTSRSALQLAHAYTDNIKASLGCHPYETNNFPDVSIFETMIDRSVVAIGECGLDYHVYKGFDAVGKKDEQKHLFEAQLRIALKHKLPVIIHCRDAYDDIFSVLDGLPSLPQGVFHCFSSGLADYREVERRGFFVGFDGNITYAKQLQTIIPDIPLEKILLETDGPYLTPVPYRGTRNEPKYIPLIAKEIAKLQHTDVTVVEEKTTRNALQLFHFS